MFTFLHAADVHLDSPLVGLDRYEGAPAEEIRDATRRALERLVDLAITKEVAFLLLAGDLFDGDWRDYNTGLFLVRQMTRLRDAGIPVFTVRGNHDAVSRITKSLRLPENVRELSARKPESIHLDDLGVVIHGQSFATRAVPEDLSAGFPPAVPGLFNIGLLHTSLNGRPGHDPYAPCTPEGLASKGYRYWALGHVHLRECIERDSTTIVFPGNLQGRHIRECGGKGATLVTVEGGEIESKEHWDLDVVRFDVAEVDLEGAATPDDGMERVVARLEKLLTEADGRLLATRIVLAGACGADAELRAESRKWREECRNLAIQIGAEALWIEKVEIRTRPEKDSLELPGLLAPLFGDGAHPDLEAVLDDLAPELDLLRRKLPREVLSAPGALDLEDREALRQTALLARDLLRSRLSVREDAR